MKNTFFVVIMAGVLASPFFLGCSKEEEVVPEIDLQKTAAMADAKENEEPALQPIQALASTSKAQPEVTASKTGLTSADAVSQGDSGPYVVQISIQPSRSNAKGIVAKLGSHNIKGYIAEVENPGELEGTYYRIRIGYFPSIEAAQNFGKLTLEPLGFAWWVDNKDNDAVGNSAFDHEDSYHAAPMEAAYEEPTPTPTPTPAPTPVQVEKAPPPQPQPEPAPVVEKQAPVVEQAPATPQADVIDDWE